MITVHKVKGPINPSTAPLMINRVLCFNIFLRRLFLCTDNAFKELFIVLMKAASVHHLASREMKTSPASNETKTQGESGVAMEMTDMQCAFLSPDD
jgi:hypothetical protein